MDPRWRKVLRDVAGNKLRSGLVVLSIAVGVFAAGSVAGARSAIERMLEEGYASVDPPHATLRLNTAPDAAVELVRGTPGVAVAERRRTATIRARAGGGAWRELSLRVVEEPDRIPIDRLRPEAGAWPAPERALLLERSAMALFGIAVGDRIEVETAGGLRAIEVAGTVHDLSLRPAGLSGEAAGYVSPGTLGWLGQARLSEQLNLRLAERLPARARVEAVTRTAAGRLADAELRVEAIELNHPGRFWAHDVVDAMTGVLTLLGAVTVAMSAFLVVNTITALLAEQTRQVGVMKAIGADASQVAGLYLVAVVLYGLAALAIAVPLAALASSWLAGYSTRLLNLAPPPLTWTAEVLALEVAAGLLVPLLAAFGPVLAGSRLTVREALDWHGLAGGQAAVGVVLRAATRVLRLGRPAALSFRNTFRKRWRLALTVGTLTLSGAAFVATLSVREALLVELDAIFGIPAYDVELRFVEPYPVAPVLRQVRAVPEAAAAEAWAGRPATRVRDGEPTGQTFAIVGIPPDTRLIRPRLLEGRWLRPDDENALVINTDLQRRHPDLHVGGGVEAAIDGEARSWRIVGLVRSALEGQSGYANEAYFRRVLGGPSPVGDVRVVARADDPEGQARAAALVEERLRGAGLRVSLTRTIAERRAQQESNFAVILGFLMGMTALLAVVGGLGLTGTLSISVIERTREIGVMRAIGADDRDVASIVVGEGVTIALLSWALGLLAAVPLGQALTGVVADSFLNGPMTARVSASGALLWLLLSVGLAAVASFLPAWNASRLPIREALAYQ